MLIRSKLLLLPLLLGLAGAVQATEECATVVQCNQVGSVAYQDGRHEQAIEAFERQLRRVENGDTAQLELALNNLILANLRAGQAGMARAWLGVALANNLSGSSTRLHLRKVAEALDYPVLSASPVGRYLRYGGQAVWSELQISEDGNGGYHASFSPVRAGARVEEYGPAAIGELDGKLVGDVAFAEIALLWMLIVVTIVLFWRLHRLAALLLVPYLAWVSFAAALNFSLWQLNPAVLG